MAGKPAGDGAWGWVLAMVWLILALAQPRWGKTDADRPPGRDVVLLVDTSRSMGVEDAVPDRLGLAVSVARSVVEAMGRDSGDRVAVVAFADRGVIRCPLTENLGAAKDALDDLRPGDISPAGTDLGAGLDAAIDAFDPEEHSEGRAILVLSDGEDHAGAWQESARRLEIAKTAVHAVVVGDPAKGREVPEGRGGLTHRFQGKAAVSTRSDAALIALTRQTGGSFVPLGLARGDSLGVFFRDRIGPSSRRLLDDRVPPDRPERFPIFIAAALASGLIGSWKLGRRRALLLLAMILVPGAGPLGESAAEAVLLGNASYRRGDLPAALAAFQRAASLDSRSAVARYDVAATLFRMGRPAEAKASYREASERADLALKTKIDFALGNTALAVGEIEAAIGHYDDCIASKVVGEESDRVRRDAIENRLFALKQRSNRRKPPDSNPGNKPPPPPEAKKDRSKQETKRPEPSKPADSSSSPSEPSPGANPPADPPSGDAPDSPGGRLKSALKDIRDAKNQRLPDAPRNNGQANRKDW